jgi:nitrogen regulatory protein P-II 1
MKKVEAIIRSSKFEDVTEALENAGINFFTFLQVSGHGKQKGDEISYRGAHYDSGHIPRLKLELIVPDEKVETVVNTIMENARTGKIGDGKVIVTPVDSFYRIRTGESGDDAL